MSVSQEKAIKPVRLTEQVKAGGCASKISPAVLDQILGKLPKQIDERVLVGFETADDAGVYLISDDLALVQTVDFFTPMVDDPFTFGQVAATNALSDVYAMGGTPHTALAMVCFPENGDLEILEAILQGGMSKMIEAACSVIGGHSVKDPEMKFGYAVTGSVHPSKIFKNAAAQPGDVLIFTKAIGTGVIATALKRGLAEEAWVESATTSMTTLNRTAGEIAQRFKVHAATDVTGFGLLGHLREMALGARVGIEIESTAVPLLTGSLECVRLGAIPGGLNANRAFVESCTEFSSNIPDDLKTLLFDPQTAGGLLFSLPETEAIGLQQALSDAGVAYAAQIGRVGTRADIGALLKVN
jgi:selenide,water dikinase